MAPHPTARRPSPPVLDHVFTDAIDALRGSLEQALLERLAVEEHLNADVLLGDLTWETSYGLLGETSPARVRADISLLWSTWSQSSFREWYVGEGFGEPPRIDIEVTLRVQRLVDPPDIERLFSAAPTEGPVVGGEPLLRSGPTVERSYDPELTSVANAFEVAYSGSYELDEETLEDSTRIDTEVAALGGWIAAALVRLNDLELRHLPDEASEDL